VYPKPLITPDIFLVSKWKVFLSHEFYVSLPVCAQKRKNFVGFIEVKMMFEVVKVLTRRLIALSNVN